MFQSIQNALNAYTKRPLFFIYNSFLYAFFQLLIALAIVGVFLVGIFVASALSYSPTSLPLLLFYSILIVVFFYFTVAFHGSLIRSYWDAFKGQPTDWLGFYRYALDNGFRFFWIFVAKLAVEFVFLAPLALIYIYVLKNVVLPYLEVVLALVFAFWIFVANFLFFGAFIAAALYESSARNAIRAHFGFLRRRHILALIFYGMYVSVLIGNALPLVQLLTLFVLYPLILTAFILYFDATVQARMAGAAAPVRVPAIPRRKG